MKKYSTQNTYLDSYGKRWTSAQIEKKIHQAKVLKYTEMMDEYGYIFCEDCERNDCTPVDMSHDISVDQCKKNGYVEKAWDVNNITMRGRTCHRKHDKI